jgi:phosphatidylinositol alpha 1,6-mannosyltransferase
MRGAVETLVGDVGLRRIMGERARLSVEGRTWETLGDELLEFYAQLTGVEQRSRWVA